MLREPRMRISVWLFGLVIVSACTGNPPQTPKVGDARTARVGSLIHDDEPVTKVLPVLPPDAAARGARGPVLLEIRIAETGTVSVLRVLRGHPLLDDLARSAAEQWTYRPVVIDGRAVPIIKAVVVSFAGASGAPKSQLDIKIRPGR
jgi:TonB family protein